MAVSLLLIGVEAGVTRLNAGGAQISVDGSLLVVVDVRLPDRLQMLPAVVAVISLPVTAARPSTRMKYGAPGTE